jgi:hypothetical protein
MDPANNASAAKVLYTKSGLAPWVSSRGTWGDSSHMPRAIWAVVWHQITDPLSVTERVAPAVSTVTGAVGDTTATIGRMADTVEKTGSWLSVQYNWLRIAEVVAGGTLILVGVAMLTGGRAAPAAARAVVGATIGRKAP